MDLHNQVDIAANRLTRRGHPVDCRPNQAFEGHVLEAGRQRVEFDRGEAFSRRFLGARVDLLGRAAAHQQVQADLIAALAAQQLPDRRLEALAFEVPQGDVHRADRAADDVAAKRRQAIQVLPVVFDPHRILADEILGKRLHHLVDG